MGQHDTSPTLIERLRDPADAAAWSRFQSIYGDLVVRYCRAKGLQPADAEDTWQFTLLKLTQALPKFTYDRARGRFRDYLFVVVRSAITRLGDRLKSGSAGTARRAQRADDPTSDAAHAPARGDEAWEREWRDFHFRRAWLAITPDFEPQSLAAFECLLGGQSISAVAGRFAMTEQGLHKVKQRVRNRLAEQIRVQVIEEDGGE